MRSSFRRCELCEETKSIDDFANAGNLNGIQYHRYKCKSCYTKFKQIRKNTNRAWFNEYRKTLKCIECGNSDHRVIEFHHRDPAQKDMAVTLMMSYSREKIEKEIAKCDALCANCHRILHYEEREAKKSGD